MLEIQKFPRGVPGRDLRDNIAPYATWADPKYIAAHPHWKYQPGKIFLGRVEGQLIGVSDDRHMLTIAGSRAGKDISAIVPNLLEYPGSMLVIDPKGEDARRTKARCDKGNNFISRGLGQNVHVLDPFGVSGYKTSSFNPLSMIDPKADTAVDDAALAAEALIIPEQGPGAHFSSSGRNFLRGLILYVCSEEPLARRNLLRLRQLLTLDSEGIQLLLAAMRTINDRCGGVIARAANSICQRRTELSFFHRLRMSLI